jgi:AcrR family transcriptional regulator
MSKAGIQTLFGSKETLQLATVDHARTMFIDFVTRPSLAAERGVDRVRALIERWIVYAERPLFAGGCFQAANLADFDSRPGPVRDALARNQQAWIDTLSAELAHAVAEHEIAALDPDLAAFQLDAVLRSANTALQLGDTTVIDKIRRIVDGILAPPAQGG